MRNSKSFKWRWTEVNKRNEIDNLFFICYAINILLLRFTGNSQYRNRLEDIALLKIEIGNLRSQKNLLSRGLANTVDMRQEVLQLNRDLTQERVKAKALEQEMMTPMNIHRWRKLTGKDPNRMDLIVKIQTLQKYDSLCVTIKFDILFLGGVTSQTFFFLFDFFSIIRI